MFSENPLSLACDTKLLNVAYGIAVIAVFIRIWKNTKSKSQEKKGWTSSTFTSNI